MTILCDSPLIEITLDALAWLTPFLRQVEQELGEPAFVSLIWGETWVFPPSSEDMPTEASEFEKRWEELVNAPGTEHEWQITVGFDLLSQLDEDRRQRIKLVDGILILVEASTFAEITTASGLTIYLDEARDRLDHRPRAGGPETRR